MTKCLMLEGKREGNGVPKNIELIPLKKYINEQKQSRTLRREPKENEMKRNPNRKNGSKKRWNEGKRK